MYRYPREGRGSGRRHELLHPGNGRGQEPLTIGVAGRLVLRTSMMSPVWRGGNDCFEGHSGDVERNCTGLAHAQARFLVWRADS